MSKRAALLCNTFNLAPWLMRSLVIRAVRVQMAAEAESSWYSNTFLCSNWLSLATTNYSVLLSVSSPFMDMTTSSKLLAAAYNV